MFAHVTVYKMDGRSFGRRVSRTREYLVTEEDVNEVQKCTLAACKAISVSQSPFELKAALDRFHAVVCNVFLDDFDDLSPISFVKDRVFDLLKGDVADFQLKVACTVVLTDILCNSKSLRATMGNEIVCDICRLCIGSDGQLQLELLELIHCLMETGSRETRDAVALVLTTQVLSNLFDKGNFDMRCEIFRILFSFVQFDNIDLSFILDLCVANLYKEEYSLLVLDCLARIVPWFHEIIPVDFDRLLANQNAAILESAFNLMESMSTSGQNVHVTLPTVVRMIGSPGDQDDVQFHAALALHKIIENNEAAALELINSSNVIHDLMGGLGGFTTRVRFHVAWVLLFCASKVTEFRQLIVFIPKNDPVTFATIAKDILDMDHQTLTVMFLQAWDAIFKMSSHIPFIRATFLDQFPGDTIWEYFSFTDPNVDAMAETFLSTWFGIEGE